MACLPAAYTVNEFLSGESLFGAAGELGAPRFDDFGDEDRFAAFAKYLNHELRELLHKRTTDYADGTDRNLRRASTRLSQPRRYFWKRGFSATRRL
jgi:hypothetical protein